MQATFTVPATAIYTDSVTGGRYHYAAGQVIPLDLAVRLGMPGATAAADTSPFSTDQDAWMADTIQASVDALEASLASVYEPLKTAGAATATADGTGTGTIPAGLDFVTVTSDDANKIIVLPAPTPGVEVTLANGATGYELRSSAPATVAINGGSGAAAESAIGASVVVTCLCKSATAWICRQAAANGTLSAVEAAAP